MAKTKKKRAPARTAALAEAAASAQISIIEVPAGGTLKVVVDVGPMSIPYTVQYAGKTLIKALVDRAEDVSALQPGDRVLGWSFAHTEKSWHHDIGVIVDGGPIQVLESRSEANKDSDHSVGVVVVRA